VTHLRKMMLEELQRRNYSAITTRNYLRVVTEFAKFFGKSPDKLGLNELRTYQAYLLRERKLTPGTVINQVAALRFFFVKTLKRHQFRDFLPYPQDQRRLPTVLSREEVSRLINAGGTLFRRTLLMTLYGTGMRRSELAHLKVGDIDSQRMIIRVVAGKRSKDRDLPLSPALLETLREYWRWRKPKLYLFPTRLRRVPSESPISDRPFGSHVAKLRSEPASSSHLIKHHSQRKRVGPRIEGLAFGLLRREVCRCAHNCTIHRLGEGRCCRFRFSNPAVNKFGQAEVQYFHQPVFIHHDVRRLEASVNDSGSVGGGHRICNLYRHIQQLVEAYAIARDHVAEGFPVHILHGNKVVTGLARDVVNNNDVGMFQR